MKHSRRMSKTVIDHISLGILCESCDNRDIEGQMFFVVV